MVLDRELGPLGLLGDLDGLGCGEAAASALLGDDVLDAGCAEGVELQGVIQGLQDFRLPAEADHIHDFLEVVRQVELGMEQALEIGFGLIA